MSRAVLQPDIDLGTRGFRVALYSHDTMGLGHIRRNLLVAKALSLINPEVQILLINGVREAARFELPSNTDVLTLPAVYKRLDGRYRSRSLQVSLPELIRLRSNTICAALESFIPDILIVDNVPRGMGEELDVALATLCTHGRTRCVLGLRDVLDEPALVQSQWRKAANEQVILDYYDSVWVYGDSAVYDTVREYRFSPEVAAKVRYVGYLDQSKRADGSQRCQGCRSDDPLVPQDKYVLCLLGGGQDGQRLAESFLQSQLPDGMVGVLVAGPLMDPIARTRLHDLGRRGRFRVLDSIADTACLVKYADRVVAMGGYNTVGELLSWKKRGLVVPRVVPRQEQLIRAQRLQSLGLLDMMHPDQLSPASLSKWLAEDRNPHNSLEGRLDFNALTRLPGLAMELVSHRSSSEWEDSRGGGLLRVAR